MINFIICSNSKKNIYYYREFVNKFALDKRLDNYIYELCILDNKINKRLDRGITGKKIYIIDVNDCKCRGLDLGKAIRNSGDWDSYIIVIMSDDYDDNLDFVGRTLDLDFVVKGTCMKRKFIYSLAIAINILNRQSFLTFKCNGEIVQVAYSDIYYIEKNLNSNDATIVTKNSEFVIKYSINKLMDVIGNDIIFFKCHRSCIVNLNNITSFDLDNNVIRFKNKDINLISRKNKQELKNRLLDRGMGNVKTKNH